MTHTHIYIHIYIYIWYIGISLSLYIAIIHIHNSLLHITTVQSIRFEPGDMIYLPLESGSNPVWPAKAIFKSWGFLAWTQLFNDPQNWKAPQHIIWVSNRNESDGSAKADLEAMISGSGTTFVQNIALLSLRCHCRYYGLQLCHILNKILQGNRTKLWTIAWHKS